MRRLRRLAAVAAASPAVEPVLVRLAALLGRSEHELVVLTYHRVARPGAQSRLHPGLLSATPEQLERQIDWLRRHARVVSLAELLGARARRRLPRNAVLITFDDGYADFAEEAWPRLQAAGIPVTLFLATGAPGWSGNAGGFWWDRLHAAIVQSSSTVIPSPLGPIRAGTLRRDPTAFTRLTARLKDLPHGRLFEAVDAIVAAAEVEATSRGIARDVDPEPDQAARRSVLDWATVRRLAAEGVTIAPHTRTHPILTRIPVAQAEEELEGSREDLHENIGDAALNVLAYPSGAFDAVTLSVVEQLGFELAFTTQRGINRIGRTDRLALHRFNVGSLASAGGLAAQTVVARLAPERSAVASGRRL